MGVRSAVVVCVTSFLLGALFTHWIADSLTLWKSPVTDQHLWTAASYYSILAKGPSQIFYVLAAVVLAGGATILWSLNDLRAGNIMFDGGSIFLFGTTIVMYINSVLPSIFSLFSSLPTHQMNDPIPRALRTATLDLASNNLICSVALTGVLALQAGRFWAESGEEDEDEDFVVVEAEESQKGRKSRGKTPEISLRDDKVKPLLQRRVQAS
ncbi:Shr3 amino acid permease chaperone [Gymnopilus junonius]|uniref:Shr3 amino acid permease chaperone n=1 Tax=Gymnopilus junonius TaxID=109634 RepID=A0A9P5NPG8_GYMJU|nr:Shr3 amino acid permease chaperone [Gymnopilus junonius]